MGEDITVREIGIYLLNRVEVTLKDDSRNPAEHCSGDDHGRGQGDYAFGCGGYPAGRGTDRL